MVKQITASPPTTPPTIGPMFVDFCSEGWAVEFGIDDDRGNSGKILALEVGGVEIWIAEFVGCEVESPEEILLVVLETDVVVASTVFGTARRLSVLALFPQAMYSKD
jgi:hypothetical protein